MVSLFQSGKYGVIDTSKTITNGFYVIQFISETYKLQNNTKTNGQIISAGELVVKTQYLCSMKEKLIGIGKTVTATECHSYNTPHFSSIS